jgi:hypothetical protein
VLVASADGSGDSLGGRSPPHSTPLASPATPHLLLALGLHALSRAPSVACRLRHCRWPASSSSSDSSTVYRSATGHRTATAIRGEGSRVVHQGAPPTNPAIAVPRRRGRSGHLCGDDRHSRWFEPSPLVTSVDANHRRLVEAVDGSVEPVPARRHSRGARSCLRPLAWRAFLPSATRLPFRRP